MAWFMKFSYCKQFELLNKLIPLVPKFKFNKMIKFFFLVAFSLTVSATYAQDIKEIRNYTLLGQNQKAKEAVDKFLAVPKNAEKAEGWFYKGVTYNQLSKDSTKTLAENAALKTTAF